jgi:uncharacterized protein
MQVRRYAVIVGMALALGGGALVAQRGSEPGGGRGGQGGSRGGVEIKEGEECPPGMTEVRHLRCQPPMQPAPSIVDYRPRSTVVAEEHLVPKAKYPVVDVHNHTNATEENMPQLVKEMDALNLRVLVNLSGGSDPEVIRRKVETIRNSSYKDRFRVFANVNWDGAGGPGWKEKAVADLEQSIKNGAIGLKIFKELGLRNKKADGSRLHIDDPDLDPIWDLCARLNIPVIIHTADPEQFFETIDNHNERWLELNLFAGRAYPQDRYPSFEELVKERDTMFAKHPKTRYIAAHFGWYGNDLGKLSKLLDANPNVYPEVAAVLYEFGRQPRAARDFFIKYQDRVMFGKDVYEPTEYPYYWRVFETKDEYFDYYRHYHAFWKLYGMDLPDDVLKKLYYRNALKVEPGLPQTGWPQ